MKKLLLLLLFICLSISSYSQEVKTEIKKEDSAKQDSPKDGEGKPVTKTKEQIQAEIDLVNEAILLEEAKSKLYKKNLELENKNLELEEVRLKTKEAKDKADNYKAYKLKKEADLKSKPKPYIEEQSAVVELNAEKTALINSTLIYKKTIISTNFTIPLVRFNFIEGDDTKQGDILLFNSIGAGIGIYGGRLERTRDDKGEIIDEEFSNTFGVNIGALFSAGTGEANKNVFAPVLNVAALDFQIGVGVELGSLLPSQKRTFLTLSYSIPLYKLFKKGYRIIRSYDMPIESTRKSLN
jgi:hypothetical protein